MNAQPEALIRAHVKPGTKFYHGGHGTSHFGADDELHLPESHVQRLVKDGLLHDVTVPAASRQEPSSEQPEAVATDQPDAVTTEQPEAVATEQVVEEPHA